MSKEMAVLKSTNNLNRVENKSIWSNFNRFKKGQRFRPQETEGDMSLRFTSDNRNHAAGAECTVECVEAASTTVSTTTTATTTTSTTTITTATTATAGTTTMTIISIATIHKFNFKKVTC